jgi:hypothetical protein
MRHPISKFFRALFVLSLIGVAPGISKAQADSQPGAVLPVVRVVAGPLGP